MAKKDTAAANLKDFIEYLKLNSSKLSYGHAGVGSISHVSGLVFNSKFGLTPTLVPYRGTGPARYVELGSSAPNDAERGSAGLQKLVESEVARITPIIKAAGVTAN